MVKMTSGRKNGLWACSKCPTDDIREPLSMLSLHQRVSHIEEQKLLSWVGIGFSVKRSTRASAQYILEG